MGKNSWYGVNGGPDAKNQIHAPGVSTHARLTRRLGLSYWACLITILKSITGQHSDSDKLIRAFCLSEVNYRVPLSVCPKKKSVRGFSDALLLKNDMCARESGNRGRSNLQTEISFRRFFTRKKAKNGTIRTE